MKVKEILENLHSGQWALPAFQRDIVWDSEQIRALLDSIYKEFPVGMVIIWKPDNSFRGKPKILLEMQDEEILPAANPSYIIDGLQRMWALYQIFLSNKNGDRRFVFEKQGNSVKFRTVKNKSKANLLNRENSTSEVAQKILRYDIPVHIISGSYEDARQLFGRINSSNTPLSGLKFVSAFFASSSTAGIDSLDSKLSKIAEEYEINRTMLDKQFESFVEIDDILEYAKLNKNNPKKFKSDFESFNKILGEVISGLRPFGSFRDFDSDFWKYLFPLRKEKEKLNYFYEVVKNAVGLAPKGKLTRTYLKEEWAKESINPEALYRVQCFFGSAEGKPTGKRIRDYSKSQLVIHHIFPQSKWKAYKANFWHQTYLDRETNTELSNLSPREQLLKIKDNKFWAGHFVNKKGLQAMRDDDIEAFMAERQNEIFNFIFKKAKI